MLNNPLELQVQKYFASSDSLPINFTSFLKSIGETYGNYEKNRKDLQHTVDRKDHEIAELKRRFKNETEELKKANLEISRIFDNVSECFYSIQTEPMRYIRMSSACEEIYGYRAQEFLDNGMLAYEVVHADDKTLVDEQVGNLMCGKPFKLQYRIIHKDQSIRWIDARAVPVLDEAGGIRVDGIITDITEKKIIEQKLDAANDEVKRILGNIDEAIFSMDMATCKYSYIAPSCERVYGYTSEEFIANPMLWKELIHPDDMHIVNSLDERLYQDKKLNMHYRIIHKDKSIRWLDVRVVPDLDGAGILVRRDMIVNDITERKEAQINLEEANRDFSKLFNNIDEVLYSVDMKTYKLTQMSAACERVYGYTPAEFHADGELWNKLMHPDDRHLLEEQYTRLNSGQEVHNQYRIIQKAGSICWIENAIIPTMDENGKLVRLDGITKDITERKRAEEIIQESKKQYQELVEGTNEMIFSVEMEGKFLFANEEWKKTLGYNGHEVSKLNIFDIIDKESMELSQEVFGKMLAGESVRNVHVILIAKDGRRITVEGNGVPRLMDGKVTGMQGFWRDITEKKKAEEALIQSESNFREFFESAPEAISIFDMDTGHFTDSNLNALKLYKYSNEELLQMGPGDVSPQFQPDGRDSASAAREMLGQVMAGASPIFEWVHCDSLGNNIICEVRLTKLSVPGRNLIRASLIDIRDKKAAEAEIIALNESLEEKVIHRTEQLETANKELEAFSYSVSHDLRAPLRVINGFGKMLLKKQSDKLDNEGKENLQVMMTTAKQMGELIDDLLNFSRLGRAELTVNKVDMIDMVAKITQEAKLSGKNAKAEIYLHNVLPAICDAALMKQVWINLISNAVKYSRKKEHPVIEIGSMMQKGNLMYYIKDNGAGFNMAHAGKLFGVFQRLHKVKEYEGTGVGLALAHRIITKHGGMIWADAKVNEGATFYFTLPNQQSAPAIPFH